MSYKVDIVIETSHENGGKIIVERRWTGRAFCDVDCFAVYDLDIDGQKIMERTFTTLREAVILHNERVGKVTRAW